MARLVAVSREISVNEIKSREMLILLRNEIYLIEDFHEASLCYPAVRNTSRSSIADVRF